MYLKSLFYSHENWSQIKAKNEAFFDEHSNEIFNAWSPEVVKLFRSLFFTKLPNGQPLITQDQKDHIWKGFQSLVKISIHFIHESRQPYKSSDGSIAYRKPQTIEYVDDLPSLINEWSLRDKLRFN